MKLEVYQDIKKYMAELIKGTEFENKVFCVGGCCRDEILKNEIKDIDIVIELPDGGIRFAQWLHDNKHTNGSIVTYPTYGTSMFKLDKFPDIEIEAVQTRSEKYIDRDSRNPSTEYGTIKEDCMRRDLTINAIYCNVSTGEYLDICGTSLDDIKNHIIRTPCDPNITYIDDPLRIMRCVRFASRYQWCIEPETRKALADNVDRLSIISAERITDEFDKIISNPDPNKVFCGVCDLDEIGAFKYIFPNVSINAPLMLSPLLKERVTRVATLLYYAKDVKELLMNRKYPNDFINEVCTIITLTKRWMKIFLENMLPSYPVFRKLQYECKSADMLNKVFIVMCVISPMMHTVFQNMPNDLNHCNYKLPVNGDDIMSYWGLNPGPFIKQCLDFLIEKSFEYPHMTAYDCQNFLNNYFTEIGNTK